MDIQLNTVTDTTLLERLKRSDANVLDELLRTHAPQLLHYATRILGSADRAQEIVQDVFLDIWASRAEIDVTINIRIYLFWLTRNKAVNAARAESSARQREGKWAVEHAWDRSDSQAVPDAEIEAAEVRAEVWDALASAPPRCRQIFMMSWDKQMSYAEIASALGISVITVRSQVSRAMRRLVESLGPRFRNG